MSGLLISVRDTQEAEAALAGGADLIDVKEPNFGSLGAASPKAWDAVNATCRGRCPTSVALGELEDAKNTVWHDGLSGFDYAKLGLHGCRTLTDWASCWKRQLDLLPSHVVPVAVVYADWQDCNAPQPEEIIDLAGSFDCGVVLFDTYNKTRGDLLTHLSAARLQSLCHRIRQQSLRIVLGGSLQLETIERLFTLLPDYFAVRGAACNGSRTNAIEADRVSALAKRIAELSQAIS